ncbi:MAG: hypothetical protein C7B45_16075 [Sulfobacillus acidophilus]|uniref:Uncharacterized protein n=1 Tax=Sulfobacillus acidophilus TaxID=53633 RepID=A0A2T2WD66_9FIRM|nr:MAG: hypothetical protein C7B45_16075 [Sulfobacillus acidophilus]
MKEGKGSRRFFGQVSLVVGLAVIMTGCGAVTPVSVAPIPQPSALARMFLGQRVVKRVRMRAISGMSSELVVSESAGERLVRHEWLSLLRFNESRNRWGIVWRSPSLSVQQSLLPNTPSVVAPVSAMKMLRVGSQGTLVALLTPASLGASAVWNDAVLGWIPTHGAPRTLWAITGNPPDLLDNGTITRLPHALLVGEDACWGVEAFVRKGHPTVKYPSCTQLLAVTAGQRLGFSVSGPHHRVDVRKRHLTISNRKTIVFWPNNPRARQMANQGRLAVLGGPVNVLISGKISVDEADTLGLWSYRFTRPGRYVFAVVPSADLDGRGAISPVWTVRVRR